MSKTVIIDTTSPAGSYAEALKKPKQCFIVELPFPPSRLRPNAGHQGNWRAKSTAAKQYRRDCLIACQQATGTVDRDDDSLVMVTLTYHGSDKRHRDLDNLLAMTKQGIDAIAEHIGIDDKHFEFTIRRGEVRKPSVVVVTI